MAKQTFYGAHNIGSKLAVDDNNRYHATSLKTIPADQVGGPEGEPRFYTGEATSRDMGFADTKADLYAMGNMLTHSDSTSYQDAIQQFPESNYWKANNQYDEEFFKQYGYYPNDIPQGDDGYDISHEEYMQQLNPEPTFFGKLKGRFGLE